MGFIDALAVFLFLVAILAIGMVASRRVFTKGDYLLAGRNVSKWPLALSFAATDMGGAGIVGTMALAYTVGISGSFWVICAVPGLIALAFFIPKLLCRRNVTTVPELFGKRFDEKTRILVAVLQIVSAIFMISVQNIVTSYVIQTLTGIPFEVALIISTVVFIVYTTAGGMISVIWTDIFAYLVLMVGVMVSVAVLYFNLDGANVVSSLPDNYWSLGGLSNMTVAAWLLMNVFIFSTSQPYVQRVFAAKDEDAVKFAYLFTGFSYIIYGVVIALLGMFAFALSPTATNIEYDSVKIVYEYLPTGLRSIVLISFLAATMSTGSSYLNGCASIFTIDIYKRVINKKAKEVQYLKVAKYSTFAMATIAFIASFFSIGVIDVVVYANLIYSATIFFPLILGLKYEWINANSAFYAIVGGLVIGGLYAIIFYIRGLVSLHPIFIASTVSLVLLLTISSVGRGKSV